MEGEDIKLAIALLEVVEALLDGLADFLVENVVHLRLSCELQILKGDQFSQ